MRRKYHTISEGIYKNDNTNVKKKIIILIN